MISIVLTWWGVMENRMIFFMCSAVLFLSGCSAVPIVAPVERTVQITDDIVRMARYACFDTPSKSVVLLESLCTFGFPVNHAVDERGGTLLHKAAGMGNKKLVRFLLANGADRMRADKDGRRPIDEAYGEKQWGACRLLALKPSPSDTLIDGVPEGVWDVVFREQFPQYNEDNTRFLVASVDGKPVSDAFARWVTVRGGNVGTSGYAEGINQDTGKKVWRDAATGEEVILCWFFIEARSNTRYRIVMNSSTAPDARAFSVCEAWRKYGYWLGERTGSGHVDVFSPMKSEGE